MLHITLNFSIVEFTADETLGIENGTLGIGIERILGAVTNSDKDGMIRIKKNGKVKGTYSRSSSLNPTHDGVIRCP